jgi:very-short-patch-repair endonuclease
MSDQGSKTATPQVVRRAPIDARKLALARRFRRAPTPAEATAWGLLRNRGLLGLKFRRQQVIEGFVVDFYCASLRLVLELDGGVHQDPAQREYDAIRSEVMEGLGMRVLRIANEHVDERSLRQQLGPYVAERGSLR